MMVKEIIIILVICLLIGTGSFLIYRLYEYEKMGPYRKGVSALKEGNFIEALNKLEPFAKDGDLLARLLVAEIYAAGLGVEANNDIAKQWLSCDGVKSCIDGEPEYGFAHNFINAPHFDKEKAIYWMRISSDKGYNKADEWLAENDPNYIHN